MNFKSLLFFLVLVVAAYGVCELPVVVGPCRGYFERWVYSGGACELFGYSGCGGNDNNFDTKEICELTCLNKTNEPGVCELPVVVGPCRGYFERWVYSGGACELFGYSGCGGNDNNFDTKEICELTCLNKTNEPDVCELPKSLGHCRAKFERWYYSGGTCQVFSYSGCGGNGNNFKTKKSCELTCLNGTNGPEDKEVMLDEEVKYGGIEKINGDVLKGAGL